MSGRMSSALGALANSQTLRAYACTWRPVSVHLGSTARRSTNTVARSTQVTSSPQSSLDGTILTPPSTLPPAPLGMVLIIDATFARTALALYEASISILVAQLISRKVTIVHVVEKSMSRLVDSLIIWRARAVVLSVSEVTQSALVL